MNTGKVIIETQKERNIEPMAVPGIVVKHHGSFRLGKDAAASVYHAEVMDVVVEMNRKTLTLNPKASMA